MPSTDKMLREGAQITLSLNILFKALAVGSCLAIYGFVYLEWDSLGLKKWILLACALLITPYFLRACTAKVFLTDEAITRTSCVGFGSLLSFGYRRESIAWSEVDRVRLILRGFLVWFKSVAIVPKGSTKLDIEQINIASPFNYWRPALHFALERVPPHAIEPEVSDLARSVDPNDPTSA